MVFKDIEYCGSDFRVRRGCVTVSDGVIASLTDEAPEGAYGEVVSGEGKLLIPGLVNAHGHLPMTLLRGWGEGAPLDRWLSEYVYPFEDLMTPDDAYWASLTGIAEMLAGGVTSFSDMYSFCDSICQAVRISGIKCSISRGLVSFDGGGLDDGYRHGESLSLIRNWNGACGGRILAETSIHAEYTSNERFVRELAAFAKSNGLRVQIHLSETKKEHDECVKNRGRTPAEYFRDTGLFDNPVTAAHCVHVTESDMDILRERGVIAVHNPTSNLKLGGGIAPVVRMAEKGITVALGTDGASSNNNLNMFEEMHLAGLIHRGVAMDAALTPAPEILKMATLHGAAAQGRADTGRIAVGARADLAVIDLEKPHLTPSHDLLANAVFAAQSCDVVMTVVDGEIVYRDGKILTFDAGEAMKNTAAAARRIAKNFI
jgi:5-methylthioadenosine/S-adenosylhomocysteine deaminase